MAPRVRVPLEWSHFARCLQRHFRQRDVDAVSFLVVGLRVEEAAVDMSLLTRGICAVLDTDDEVLADMDRGRIAVLLASGEFGAAQRFLHDLKAWLFASAPVEAHAVLSHVTTTFIPDGCGYTHADDLLKYLMSSA